jgi:hypothetical protein
MVCAPLHGPERQDMQVDNVAFYVHFLSCFRYKHLYNSPVETRNTIEVFLHKPLRNHLEGHEGD